MAEGLLASVPAVISLDSISPTRFIGIEQCALREMWSAAGAPHLLPSSPVARVGTVIHHLLEEAGRGSFASGDARAVDRRWRELIAGAERKMADGWLERHFVPLSRSVRDFEVRRIQARERALKLSVAMSAARERVAAGGEAQLPLHGCEVPVSTPDQRVRGRIDEVALGKQGPIIRDYKSGTIFEHASGNEHVLKAAYETQVRMYAALYAATSGRWPARLELVPILGAPETVTFDPDDCSALVEAAREALGAVNEAISAAGSPEAVQERLASPHPDVCTHCVFRPWCRPYRAASVAAGGHWPHDVCGRLKNIVTLAAGRVIIEIGRGDGVIRIRVVGSALRHPALDTLQPGDVVAVYNTRPTGSPTMLAESPFTVVYKVPQSAAPRPSGPLTDAPSAEA